jgi:monofunctional biosynthetic peptidoglycan transglycosylase
VLAVSGVLLVASVGSWYVLIPYPWRLKSHEPARTSLMEQRAREAGEAGAPIEIRQEWVALEDISPNLVRAVLVAEDYRFREHGGVDWVSVAEEVQWTGDEEFSWTSSDDLGALWRALRYAWSNRDEVRGRSTITQQLAKNLYFGTDRSFQRKAMELIVAGRLERRLGKDRILELYLNVAEWGPGIFGAEAAAHAYFGRSTSSLTIEQAASLAGTLPHPLTSNPAYRPGRMRWRQDLILARLDSVGAIPASPAPVPEPTMDVGTLPDALSSPPPPESDREPSTPDDSRPTY